MAAPSLTFTLTNGATADADQVMQNFNDLLNGYTDGTKDLSINALTVAGSASFNGTVDLGNATGDLISVAGRFDTGLIPTSADTYDLGSTTGGWANLYLGDNSQYVAVTAAPAASASWTFTFPATAGSASQLLRNTGSGTMGWTGVTIDASDNITTTGEAYIGASALGGVTSKLQLIRTDTATSVSAFDAQLVIHNDDSASSTAGRYSAIDLSIAGSAGGTANAVISAEYASAGNANIGFYTDSSNVLGKRLEISSAGNFDFQAGDLTTTGNISITPSVGAERGLTITNGSTNAAAQAYLYVGNSTSNSLKIYRQGNSATINYDSQQAASNHNFQVAGTDKFQVGSSDVYAQGSDANKKMTFNTSGRLLVNTNADTTIGYFQANNSSYTEDIVFSESAGRGDSTAYNLLRCTNSSGDKLVVRGDGNVGIGTTDPDRHLEIHDTSSTPYLKLSRDGEIGSGGDVGIIEFEATTTGNITSAIKSQTENTSEAASSLKFFTHSGSASTLGMTLNSSQALTVVGALSKGSGSFLINHPDPAKTDTHKLRHCFVESPTAGDNIYRYEVEAKKAGESVSIELPGYWKHLNENPQIWVTAKKGFARAWGEVIGGSELLVHCESKGVYNVLLIGTRKDEVAKKHWEGYSNPVEPRQDEFDD